jgi:hypothetical protein
MLIKVVHIDAELEHVREKCSLCLETSARRHVVAGPIPNCTVLDFIALQTSTLRNFILDTYLRVDVHRV